MKTITVISRGGNKHKVKAVVRGDIAIHAEIDQSGNNGRTRYCLTHIPSSLRITGGLEEALLLKPFLRVLSALNWPPYPKAKAFQAEVRFAMSEIVSSGKSPVRAKRAHDGF